MDTEKIGARAGTDHAPPERATREQVNEQADILSRLSCGRILDCLGAAVFLLNEQRQIVMANQIALESVLGMSMDQARGLRPGEALGCVNADRNENGCGTSEWCRDCGAVNAMLCSLTTGSEVQECRITRRKGGSTEALDLLVTSRTLTLEGVRFLVVTLTDTGHEKRRRALERIFFHDLMNLGGGLESLVREFSRALSQDKAAVGAVLERGFNQLMDEIQSQKVLSEVENGELVCKAGDLDTLEVLDAVAAIYERHKAARGRVLRLDPKAWRGRLLNDRSILFRVLSNLVKNALEATPKGGTVTLGCDRGESTVRFWVHNPGIMPDEVRRQVFNRSFTTKGAGRGLGTYSVKLLTETCLGGEADFTVDDSEGVVFHVDVPVNRKKSS